MPPGSTNFIARPDCGGLPCNPQTIYSHRMRGALDELLLQNAVSLAMSADRQDGKIRVSVTITNDRTGHHVPTDSPLRHLILLVRASDEGANPLEQIDGPMLPAWTGQGDPSQGYYAGLPGRVYAKVLRELWTNRYPTGAYWSHTQILSDNRIPALQSDTTAYTFSEPPAGDVQVRVRLLFRRAFIELIDQKSWDAPDILMEEEILTLPRFGP